MADRSVDRTLTVEEGTIRHGTLTQYEGRYQSLLKLAVGTPVLKERYVAGYVLTMFLIL